MVEVRRPRKGKKMIKVLKEGQNRYVAICPNCESIMEFAKIDMKYNPYTETKCIVCPICNNIVPENYFMVKGAHKDD